MRWGDQRTGVEVAGLVPRLRRTGPTTGLVATRGGLPAMNVGWLRADLDRLLDPVSDLGAEGCCAVPEAYSYSGATCFEPGASASGE